MRPNVVLIVFDTARADALEPYGPPPGSTPSVAQLARRGVALRDVFATSNWTLPSHASLFTGLLPRSLGFGGASRPKFALRAHTDRMLPEVLRRNGYDTRGVSANLWVTIRHGFGTGFGRFVPVIGGRRHSPGQTPWARLRWNLSAVRSRIDDGLRDAARAVNKWSGSPKPPFFWFVNLMECHSPYLPPRPYNDLPWRERLRAGKDARLYQSHAGFLRVCMRDLEVPEESLARMRHLYGRAVRSMDDWLGRALERLDRMGALEDTLVIVTSDHGENFGEGHLLGHTLSLDDRLIRVPFVCAGPGAPAQTAGAWSLASVPRLIAEAAEIEGHPWGEDGWPSGVAVAHGDGIGTLAPAMAERFVEAWGLPAGARARLGERRASATDGRFKLVREGSAERLYDLHADPLEQHDVRAAHPADAERLGAAVDRPGTGAGTGTAVAPPDESAEGDTADIEERMRLLGYL